jgi:SEC-C motif-containing protein
MLCPCSSEKEFNECCQPIIEGQEALTAEQLMRARYTAYTQVNMDFIKETHDPSTRKKTNMEDNRAWAEATDWQGLEIVKTEKGTHEDTWGKVEFKAHYKSKNDTGTHHEISEFQRKNGRWFFTEGKAPESFQIVNHGPKVGRNDPCLCGSGKKYKKCCG